VQPLQAAVTGQAAIPLTRLLTTLSPSQGELQFVVVSTIAHPQRMVARMIVLPDLFLSGLTFVFLIKLTRNSGLVQMDG
jgi:hypothetical protein